MEPYADFSQQSYDEAEENYMADNPSGTGTEPDPEFKEGDALLVDLVKRYPILYDKSLSGYKNQIMRNNCWQAIGALMEREPDSCSKRWGQLRESYSRERRKREEESRSGSGLSTRRGFPLYADMSFLEKHVRQRSIITNVSARPASNVRAPLRSTTFTENVRSSASFHPSVGNQALPSRHLPFSADWEVFPTQLSILRPPTPPELSQPKSPCNTEAVTSGLLSEALSTPDITQMLILTSTPGLSPTLTSSPLKTGGHPVTASSDRLVSSSSIASSSVYSTPSPSYPYSSSPPYYSKPMLYPSSVPRPSTAPALQRTAPTARPPCSRTPSSSSLSDGIEENLPLSLPRKFSQPTACFNKDQVKSKKNDPMEASFLNLSTALQNHLTNPARNETERKVVPSDDAFANLIATELANLEEPVRSAKKIRLMQVLYEKE